jgi:uncharacterized protein (DUF4415 family)
MNAKSINIGSDLSKVDAHIIQPEEYEELPELDDAFFECADLYDGAKLIRAGRPAGSGNKEQVAIRFDKDILAAFRATGRGWQTRMNDALKEWLKEHATG